MLNLMELLNENEMKYEVLINAKNEKSPSKNSVFASVIEFFVRYLFVFELCKNQTNRDLNPFLFRYL